MTFNKKKSKWIYWAVTGPFVATMSLAALMLLAGVEANVAGLVGLGYPAYLSKILGTAKLLAVFAIVYGRFRTLKEWAYAGYTFNLIGATASHLMSGDTFVKMIGPVVTLGFVLVSYWIWRTTEVGMAPRTTSFDFLVRHSDGAVNQA